MTSIRLFFSISRIIWNLNKLRNHLYRSTNTSKTNYEIPPLYWIRTKFNQQITMFFWHREVVVLHHQTCKLDKTPAMYATNSMFINSYLLGPFYKDISHDTCCFLKSNDIIISFVFHSNILFFYKTIHSSSSSDNSFFFRSI